MNHKKISDLLDATLNDLYAKLGRELQPPSLGMEPASDAQNADEGRSWLQRNRLDLETRICKSTVVTVFLESKKVGDRVMLAAAIADLIASFVSGVAATTVAVLLVKEGLDTLCTTRK